MVYLPSGLSIGVKGLLDAPDRWTLRVPSLHPAETAFLLARPSGEAPWTSLGVARWSEGVWCFEAPSRDVWAKLAPGSRASSRTLPTRWVQAADVLVERVLAQDDVAQRGGVLDEARVNRLRYLVGTPKESTRWIDTGWALALVTSRAVTPGA